MPIDLFVILIIGMLLSIVLVRRSSRQSINVDLSWKQAAKIVIFRTLGVAGAGFLVGKSLSIFHQYQLVEVDIDGDPNTWAIGLLILGGVAAFVVYLIVMNKVSGQKVGIVELLRVSLRELLYLVFILGVTIALLTIVYGLVEALSPVVP